MDLPDNFEGRIKEINNNLTETVKDCADMYSEIWKGKAAFSYASMSWRQVFEGIQSVLSSFDSIAPPEPANLTSIHQETPASPLPISTLKKIVPIYFHLPQRINEVEEKMIGQFAHELGKALTNLPVLFDVRITYESVPDELNFYFQRIPGRLDPDDYINISQELARKTNGKAVFVFYAQDAIIKNVNLEEPKLADSGFPIFGSSLRKSTILTFQFFQDIRSNDLCTLDVSKKHEFNYVRFQKMISLIKEASF